MAGKVAIVTGAANGIGHAIAKSLVDHLKASGVAEGAGVLQINGSPTDRGVLSQRL